jgi:hypothetical protein
MEPCQPSIQSPPIVISPSQWLLDNLYNPYPPGAVRWAMKESSELGGRTVNEWLAKPRQTRLLRDRFSGCRSVLRMLHSVLSFVMTPAPHLTSSFTLPLWRSKLMPTSYTPRPPQPSKIQPNVHSLHHVARPQPLPLQIPPTPSPATMRFLNFRGRGSDPFQSFHPNHTQILPRLVNVDCE